MKKDNVIINEEYYDTFVKSCIVEKIHHEFLFKEKNTLTGDTTGQKVVHMKLIYDSATDLINLGRHWGHLITIKAIQDEKN